MISKAFVSIFTFETQEHIVPPFRIRRRRRGGGSLDAEWLLLVLLKQSRHGGEDIPIFSLN